MFFDFNIDEILLSPVDIKNTFFSKNQRYDIDYITRAIKHHYPNIDKYKNNEGNYITKRYKIPFWSKIYDENGVEKLKIAYEPAIGRPYVFNAKEMLSEADYEDFKNNTIENEETEMPF